MLISRKTIILVQHLVSSLSLGDCSDHRLRHDSCNLYTEQSPKESDDTRCCTNTIVLLKMSIIVLETSRRVQSGHKVFPRLQTFITRKLRGILTFFFLLLLKLVSKLLCHVFIVTFVRMQHFQTGGLEEMVRHPGNHDRRISPPLTSFCEGLLRTKCFRHQFQTLQI